MKTILTCMHDAPTILNGDLYCLMADTKLLDINAVVGYICCIYNIQSCYLEFFVNNMYQLGIF